MPHVVAPSLVPKYVSKQTEIVIIRVGTVFKHHERGVSADLREFPLSYRGVLLRPGLDFVSGVPNDGHHLLRQAYVSTSSSTE